MKIATKLKYSIAVPAAMAICTGLALFFSSMTMESSLDQGRITRRIMQSMNELSSLVHTYILYRDERPRQQFLLEQDAVLHRIAAIRGDSAEKRQLLDNIRIGTLAMQEAFLKLAAHHASHPDKETDPLLQRVEERLTGRILTKSGEVIADTLRLESLIHDEIAVRQGRINLLIFLVLLAITLPLTTVLIRMLRSITTSLAALRQGTEVIAAGNLHHRIGVTSGDEIGDLARAFNRMTEQLRDTTVSRNELSREVHERRLAEEQLTQAHLLLDTVLTQAPVGFAYFDRDLRCIIANDRLSEINTVPASSFIHPPAPETEPLVVASVKPIVDQILATGEPVENHEIWSGSLQVPGLRRCWNESWYPVRDGQGTIVGFGLVVSEISERKQAEVERERLLAERTAVMEGMTEGLILADPSGRFIYFNPASLAMFGFSSLNEALVQTNGAPEQWFFADLDGEPVPKADWPMPRVLRGEQLHGYALLFRYLATGRQLYCSFNGTLVRHADGQPLLVMLTIRDITEQTRAEQELATYRQHLEQLVAARTAELEHTHNQLLHAEKLAAIGRLAASIAHEFNNPLYGIQSVLEGIRRHAALNEDAEQLVDLALSECRRVKNLIKNLQEFNRPSTGQKTLLEIRPLLDQVLIMVKKEFKNARIAIRTEYRTDLPMIEAVADQLKQVFLNLLTNARDAMPHEGGTVTIRAERAERHLVLSFADTGTGIAAKDLPHIFEPFYSTKPAVKGTGLGLPISYGIIQAHNGTISVSSTPGQGTTFTLHLPLPEEFHGEKNKNTVG